MDSRDAPGLGGYGAGGGVHEGGVADTGLGGEWHRRVRIYVEGRRTEKLEGPGYQLSFTLAAKETKLTVVTAHMSGLVRFWD